MVDGTKGGGVDPKDRAHQRLEHGGCQPGQHLAAVRCQTGPQGVVDGREHALQHRGLQAERRGREQEGRPAQREADRGDPLVRQASAEVATGRGCVGTLQAAEGDMPADALAVGLEVEQQHAVAGPVQRGGALHGAEPRLAPPMQQHDRPGAGMGRRHEPAVQHGAGGGGELDRSAPDSTGGTAPMPRWAGATSHRPNTTTAAAAPKAAATRPSSTRPSPGRGTPPGGPGGQAIRPWQCLYFLPEPQGHGALRGVCFQVLGSAGSATAAGRSASMTSPPA